MATRRKFIGLLLLLIAAAAACSLILKYSSTNKKTYAIELYFINENATSIQAQKHEIKYEYESELPEKVIEQLRRGPSDSKSMRVMDKGVRWKITADGTRLLVDFSQKFLTTDSSKNLLATYAVVKSLCGIDGITAVKVTVEGGEIIAPDNSRIDYLTDKDINLEGDTHYEESRAIKLYFKNKDTGALESETRVIKSANAEPIEKLIVLELIKGPNSSDKESVLTPDTQILSAESAEGTAYINMSQSFVDKNSGTGDKEQNAVFAIVNSICELPNINSVQFLVEGKKVRGFQHVDISGVLYARK